MICRDRFDNCLCLSYLTLRRKLCLHDIHTQLAQDRDGLSNGPWASCDLNGLGHNRSHTCGLAGRGRRPPGRARQTCAKVTRIKKCTDIMSSAYTFIRWASRWSHVIDDRFVTLCLSGSGPPNVSSKTRPRHFVSSRRGEIAKHEVAKCNGDRVPGQERVSGVCVTTGGCGVTWTFLFEGKSADRYVCFESRVIFPVSGREGGHNGNCTDQPRVRGILHTTMSSASMLVYWKQHLGAGVWRLTLADVADDGTKAGVCPRMEPSLHGPSAMTYLPSDLKECVARWTTGRRSWPASPCLADRGEDHCGR
jgi:hypothetical protein